MKNLLILLTGLFSILYFGSIQIYAQKKVRQKEIIIIEILGTGHEEPSKNEVPINRDSAKSTWVGGGEGVACDSMDSSSVSPTDKHNCPVSYDFEAAAWRAGKDKSKISFRVITEKESDDECYARKVFMVYRSRRTNLKLNCGISLVAYYGFESQNR